MPFLKILHEAVLKLTKSLVKVNLGFYFCSKHLKYRENICRRQKYAHARRTAHRDETG